MGSPKWEKVDWIRNGPGLILMVLCIILLPEFLRSADWEFIVLILVLVTIKIKDLIKYKDTRGFKELKSIKYDSLYKEMLVESDNFIAEQLLLQVGNAVDSTYNVKKAIDFAMENYLSDIPQKPKWVDGSGLSRYNLFTPESIVFLLNTSNSAQKGYIHSQQILQNAELENLNKELKIKVMDAKAMLNLEESDKIDDMVEIEGNPLLIQ